MQYIYHRYWLVTVHRPDKESLVVESHYMDAEREMMGVMRVGVGDFRVSEARMEVYRAPAENRSAVGVIPVESLRGIIAYPSAIRAFRQALPTNASDSQADLFLEGIKGLLQAEAFVWEERGFASMRDYDEWFRREYVNSCVYYSHLHEVTQDWTEYVASHYREERLFNRHRYCSVTSIEEGKLWVQAGLSDSFHEMGVAVSVESDTWRIKGATASVLRVPDPICRRAAERVRNLAGLPLRPEARKELMKASGGPEGCAHLADLVLEGAKAITLALNQGKEEI